MTRAPDDDPDGGNTGDVAMGDGRRGRRKRKFLVFAVLPVLMLIGVMAGTYYSGLDEPLLRRWRGTPAPTGGARQETVLPAFYDLPEMLVNLDSEGRGPHYLKIDVSLELASPQDAGAVGAATPLIVDDYQVLLRGLTLDDLQGSADLARIRHELLTAADSEIRPAKVKDVLIRELLVQ